MKTSIPSVLITFALVSVALVHNTQALNPPPDGGYPGGNTAEGQNALLSLSSGTYNTRVGIYSLLNLTDGNFCTAIGAGALSSNTEGHDNTALGDSAGSDIDGSGNVCIGQGVSGEAGVDDSTYIGNVNMTEQGPADDVAFVTVRLSDGRLGHQPLVMRSASSELQKTVEELKSTLARQETTIAKQQKQIEELTVGVQKVSAQLEAGKAAPQVVNNP
jgi:uncharacterized coiled-coil protein SlyX